VIAAALMAGSSLVVVINSLRANNEALQRAADRIEDDAGESFDRFAVGR